MNKQNHKPKYNKIRKEKNLHRQLSNQKDLKTHTMIVHKRTH